MDIIIKLIALILIGVCLYLIGVNVAIFWLLSYNMTFVLAWILAVIHYLVSYMVIDSFK